MQIRKSHRILAALMALVMVFGLLPTIAFAKSVGNDGSAEMNESYAAKESLMPIGPSFNVDTLLEWTPESDPDAIYSRASITLADREGGFVVNPLVNPEAKLMLCSLANSDHDHTSAQGTESFLSYSFNYWQYTNSFVYWSGSEEGLVVCPTGEFTDAAHTNGVPVVATLGFPWGGGTGYVEQVQNFVQKAEDGSFPVADKLIEVMDYYGFDGYFFNQESYGCSANEGKLIDEMMRYMHQKRPDMLISWYDSMLPTGGVSYQNAVTSANSAFMKDSEDGTRAIDEFMMNYNWYEGQVTNTIATMKSVGRSQFDAFAGLDVQQNCMDTSFRDYLLVDEDGMTRLSVAMYCPNSTLGLSTSGENFHQVERRFYTNPMSDPRDTSVNLNSSDWAGMSRFFADRTPILSVPFVTDFNSGHGRGYYVDGVLSRDSEWSYQSNQDVMPTWTWIIDSEGNKLDGEYDFTTAYNGGNSIKFYGDLSAGKANDIMLYSTKVNVEAGTKLGLTYKGDQGLMKVVGYYGDANTTSYDDCEKVAYDLTASTGNWTTTEVDLSAQAGKTLFAIGLKIESAADVTGYQVNLGRLTLTGSELAKLDGPETITLDEIRYTDAYTAEARLYWTAVEGAVSYEVYKVNADGTRTLIMATPSTAYYIPTLTRDASETDVTVAIVPVNANGVRGNASRMTIDWAYGNDDTEKVENIVFDNVCLNAPVTGVSFENSGEPASKALDGTSANNSKWCATNMSTGWMSINIGRDVTVRRWRVEHAEYGGEANNMNTVDFALEYKNASGEWVQVKRIQDNHSAVTDVLLDEPITASEWKLVVYDDGSSPWGGIRIYEWQMFEVAQFNKTEPTAMNFASAVNGVGATDTFTLKNVPSGQTVKVYTKTGDTYTQIGTADSDGNTVTIENLDFGTAEAGRVYYTTTAPAADESFKLSAAFDAETAEKSANATDVSVEAFSRDGSNSSSSGDGIYTTLTVKGLSEGDVVYVYENGANAEYTKVSLPVAAGQTSVSIDGVYVARAGGKLPIQVKRAGKLVSDIYEVDTPAFADPEAIIRILAKGEKGEDVIGAKFGIYDANDELVGELTTLSAEGGTVSVPLGTYTIRQIEAPEGYSSTKDTISTILRIEGWEYTYTVNVPDYSDPIINSVTINEDVRTLMLGSTNAYTATMTGEGDYDESVIWTVEGATSENTRFDEKGNLTIAEDEDAAYITIVATAAKNSAVSDSVLAYVTGETAIPVNGPIFGYTGGKLDGEDGPKAAFDGDLTTKWTEEGSKWVAIGLDGYKDVSALKIYHAGSQEGDEAANTAAFELWTSGSYYNADFWIGYYENYGINVVNNNFNVEFANNYGWLRRITSITDSNEAVTTLNFTEPASLDCIILRVLDENVNIYEVEAIGVDTIRVDAAKLALRIAEIGEVTAESGDLLAELRNEYDNLPEEYKHFVRTLDQLVEAEAAYADIVREEYAQQLRDYKEELKENEKYTQKGLNRLEDALNEALKLVDAAQSVKELEKAVEDGKALLDAVPNTEEEMQETLDAAEQAVVDAAKYYAQVELSRIDMSKLTAEQKAMAEEIVEAAREAVRNATSVEEIEAILAQAKADVAATANWKCAAEAFTDVDVNAFYHESLDYMLNAGYVNGLPDGTFGVANTLTRGQLLTILYRVAGEPEVEGAAGFVDVDANEYYAKAIAWASAEGIANGYPGGEFRPDADVTRQEMVVFLYRFAKAEKVEEDALAAFPDADQVGDFAVDAFNWAVTNGIINGNVVDGQTVLAPSDSATRGQAVTILARYLNK